MKRLVAGLALVAGAIALCAQTPLPDWVLQLSRVKHHLKANFERIPNYVCTETVDRFEKLPRDSKFSKADSLRFDVAHVDNREMLALPGAHGFTDFELAGYNTTGILGTGTFSSLPVMLFVHDNARAQPHPAEGSAQLAFDYQVPAFLSAFQVRSPSGTAIVGERGMYWVDAASLDLIRIEDHAVDVPVRIGISEVVSTVEYSRFRIGDSNVLMPQRASTTVTNTNGTQRRNDITFSGCHEYVSESTITFGELPVKK